MSSAAVRQVIALASELTAEERSVVVDAIAPRESVLALAEEWETEIARRAMQVRSGKSQGVGKDDIHSVAGELDVAGVTEATVYSDLDGLCSELARRYRDGKL